MKFKTKFLIHPNSKVFIILHSFYYTNISSNIKHKCRKNLIVTEQTEPESELKSMISNLTESLSNR